MQICPDFLKSARFVGQCAWSKASKRGEIVNDLPDRISDVIIFVGVAHSNLMSPLIGYWTAIFPYSPLTWDFSARPLEGGVNLAESCQSRGGWLR
jgi:hypothetical protein